MTGKKLTEEEGKEYGLRIMKHMNDKCKEWNGQLNLGFSIYGSPIESTTYKFAKCLQERFGIVPGVTDKNYITNSYHVHVTEPISAFDKLKIESEFQTESTGGCISYVEVPNMQNNIDAVLSVMKFIYDNIMYAELNTKSDYCQVCGFDGEIKIIEENGKLIWECPNCHNRDQRKMNVMRRTCGRTPKIATVQNDRNSREALKGNLEPSLLTKQNCCDVCGRHQKHIVHYYGQKLCNKHYNQIKKYGKVLDSNPRTIYDKNEIEIDGDVAYISLYDKNFKVIAKAIIDKEDVNKVKYTKWRLNGNGYVISCGKFKNKVVFLHRRIMNVEDFIDHINGNPLDSRKSNLRVATKSQNGMNKSSNGVSQVPDGRFYAYIKIHQKMINLGKYEHKEEALFARWYAEQQLFKEFAYPKEKPILPQLKEKEIISFVNKKVQRL